MMRFLREFHANGVFPKGANSFFISLIPKVQYSQGLEQYRHIFLVGCIYKIMAKVLSNRLKLVLRSVIDERQSAFLGG